MNTPSSRRKDFESRVSYNPNSVYIHRKRGWRYIPIHPFADEPEILKGLDMRPDQCTSVDAYWEVGEDILFFEAIIESNTTRESGNYIRTDSNNRNVAMVVLSDDTVSRVDIENLMIELYDSDKLSDKYINNLTQIKSANKSQ